MSLEVSRLYHEVLDDTMELHTRVGTLIDETQEVVSVDWSLIE